MMSNFKYCPMCGSPRDGDSQFCRNCNFEFLMGEYVKVEKKSSQIDEKIEVEKVSQEEFLESNDNIRFVRDKINHCIVKYLNNELTNQYDDEYSKIVGFGISEYISSNLNSSFDENFTGDYLENIENLIHDEKLIDSKNTFIQWIGENRGHLPGMVLNQYNLPIRTNVDNLKNIISLDLRKSDENDRFMDSLNEIIDFENEFLENLI